MAAPSSTLKYAQEVMPGSARWTQEIPEDLLPVVAAVYKAFLALEKLVETAKSNHEALSTIHQLYDGGRLQVDLILQRAVTRG